MAPLNRSLYDATTAEVISETTTTLLVKYKDGSVDSVSKDSLHGALCQLSNIDPTENIHARGRALDYDQCDGDGVEVVLNIDADTMTGEIRIAGQGDRVPIKGSQLGDALVAVDEEADDDVVEEYEDIEGFTFSSHFGDQSSFDQQNAVLSLETSDELYRIYEETLKNRVREDLIDAAVGTFPSAEITDNGWVIEDTYLVTYDAENYLVDDVDIYTVSGNSVAETDGEKEAVGLSFDVEPYAEFTIDGSAETLSKNEQKFFGTVEFLTNPKQYLDIDSFETEVYSAIQQAKGSPIYRGQFEEIALTATVSHFVDPISGLLHRHDIDKHVLRSTFHINHWVVDELEFSSFDHSGLAELAWREEELRRGDRRVFWDTDNNDGERWNKIQSTENNAPCPPEVYRKLRSMYGTK